MIVVDLEATVPAPTEALVEVELRFIIFVGWNIQLTKNSPIMVLAVFKRLVEH